MNLEQGVDVVSERRAKAKIDRPQVSKERFTIDDAIYTITSRLVTKKSLVLIGIGSLAYVYAEFGYRFISFVVSR